MTGLLAFQGYSVEQTLNARGIARADLRFINQSFVPQPGQRCTIKVDTITRFEGYVHRVERQHLVESDVNGFLYRISAVDWNGLADRRIVNQVYQDITAGAIVEDMLATVLASEGVIAGTIQAGPVVTKAVFPRVTVADALRELSQITGFSWRIDEYKQLHFFQAATFPAPFAVGVSNPVFREMRADRSLDRYANKIYLQAGHGITSNQVERLAGDGNRTSWPVAYPLAELPSGFIETGGFPGPAVTFGVRQKETNKQFYWQRDENTISSDATLVLASNQLLVVTYRGLYPITVVLSAEGGISERQDIEGGTGLYELSDIKEHIDGEEAALEFALAEMRKFQQLPERVSFTTYTPWLVPGHSIAVTLPSLNLSGPYLVTDVSFSQTTPEVLPATPALRQFSIDCALTEKYESIAEYLAADAAAGKPLLIRENEVLAEPVVDDDPVAITDTIQADLVTSNGGGKWDATTRWGSCQWRG